MANAALKGNSEWSDDWGLAALGEHSASIVVWNGESPFRKSCQWGTEAHGGTRACTVSGKFRDPLFDFGNAPGSGPGRLALVVRHMPADPGIGPGRLACALASYPIP